MKDRIKEANAQSIKIPKFKGRTTIVLRNAKTGEAEQKVVEENMVTNAVANIFASNFCGQLEYAQIMPIATKTLGGILCWANPIEENAENIYPPVTSANPLTAHAGQTTYIAASDDSKRGNPNSIVSSRTATGYTNTWDFPSTQGNGLISCVALTHSDFGDFFLNGDQNFQPCEEVFLERLEASQSTTEEGLKRCRAIIDDTRRVAYGFYLTGNSINIRKFLSYGSIAQDVASGFPNSGYFDEYSITLGHSHSLYSVYMFDEAENKITLIVPKANNSNTLYRDIINLSNNTVVSDEIVVSGATFLLKNYGQRYANIELTTSGRLYLPSNHNTFYGINYSNPADTIETVNQGDYTVNLNYCGYAVNGDYIAVGNTIIEGDKNYPCKTTYSSDQIFRKPIAIKKNSPIKFSTAYRNNSLNVSAGPMINKMYLGTINNLETPVTKTSAQTMSITYELIMEE